MEPRFQRRGVGAAHDGRLPQACRDAKAPAVELDADPNAEDIYLRMGFRTIGRSPSGSIPGRTLAADAARAGSADPRAVLAPVGVADQALVELAGRRGAAARP